MFKLLLLYVIVYVLVALLFLIQRSNALHSYARSLSGEALKIFNRRMNKFTWVDYTLAFLPVFNILSAVLSVIQFTDMLDQIKAEFENYCYIHYISVQS